MSDTFYNSATSNSWNTFVPTVTLVGGGGNTVPVYVTNAGYYFRLSNIAFVQIYLAGDGGAEGAGTGTLNIALPVVISASWPTGASISCGRVVNGATENELYANLSAGETTVSFRYFSAVTTISMLTGAQQNNTTRSIRADFYYMVD